MAAQQTGPSAIAGERGLRPGNGRVLYQPRNAWVGDVIPFFHDGRFWLYYLHDRRQPASGTGMSWHLVTSDDLIHFEEYGEVVPSGGVEAPDFNAYTGSVIEADGEFHLFYTGHNPAIVDGGSGLPLQAVMHAISDDLVAWRKVPADTFYAPPGRYEPHDWRDPYVYWDPGEERYVMLLAAREVDGLARRRGCIARCTSVDLARWDVEAPLWSPGLFYTHECPEVFRMGDGWYLTFSEFSERFVARYRRATDPSGPWGADAEDALDGRAFYAPRTASDGRHRYAFGWIATKEGETDDGAWQWAGTMAVHELTRRDDGALAVSLPGPIRDRFDRPDAPANSTVVGDWTVEEDRVSVDAGEGIALTRMGTMPDPCLISTSVRFEAGTRSVGIALRVGADPDEAYYVRLEPTRHRVVFDRWPRRSPGELQWQIAGDVPHAVELERPVTLEAGKEHSIEVLVDGSACITYIDGSVAMSARMYDRPSGDWGLFVAEGAARFTDPSIRSRRLEVGSSDT